MITLACPSTTGNVGARDKLCRWLLVPGEAAGHVGVEFGVVGAVVAAWKASVRRRAGGEQNPYLIDQHGVTVL
jgi:hypothetical protein